MTEATGTAPEDQARPAVWYVLFGGKLTSNADNATIRADVAALANDHVSHGRVHDHAVAVDEGGTANMQADAVVNVHRRLDEGGLGLEGRVGKRLVMSYGQYTVLGAVTVWADDAANVLVKRGRWAGSRSRPQVRPDSLKPLLAPFLRVRVVRSGVELSACSCTPVPCSAKVRVASGEDDFGEVGGLVRGARNGRVAAHGGGCRSATERDTSRW